jgi:hypothetical protein
MDGIPNESTLQLLQHGGVKVVRIPLRIRPGQPLPFRPEDVVLHEGDIVFIEARDSELFYTAGILPPGEFLLPRDHDLDVVEAIALIGGPMISGGFNTNNINGALIAGGLGRPSPSLLTVLRRTPKGGQVTIRVDLNRAMRDPRESLLVRAGDILILQETPGEAFTRYVTQIFNFSIFSDVIQSRATTATTSASIP